MCNLFVEFVIYYSNYQLCNFEFIILCVFFYYSIHLSYNDVLKFNVIYNIFINSTKKNTKRNSMKKNEIDNEMMIKSIILSF